MKIGTPLTDDATRVMRASYPNSPFLTRGFQQAETPWWKVW